MIFELTRDEFAFLAHDEACHDCLGHEDAAAALKKRVDVPALRLRLKEARAKAPSTEWVLTEKAP